MYRQARLHGDALRALRKLGTVQLEIGCREGARLAWAEAVGLLDDLGVASTKDVERAELVDLIETLDGCCAAE